VVRGAVHHGPPSARNNGSRGWHRLASMGAGAVTGARGG
jgi:hypothetical protein